MAVPRDITAGCGHRRKVLLSKLALTTVNIFRFIYLFVTWNLGEEKEEAVRRAGGRQTVGQHGVSCPLGCLVALDDWITHLSSCTLSSRPSLSPSSSSSTHHLVTTGCLVSVHVDLRSPPLPRLPHRLIDRFKTGSEHRRALNSSSSEGHGIA